MPRPYPPDPEAIARVAITQHRASEITALALLAPSAHGLLPASGGGYSITYAGREVGRVASLDDVRGWLCQSGYISPASQPGRTLTAQELLAQLELEWGSRGKVVVDPGVLETIVELWHGEPGDRSAYWAKAPTPRQALAQALAYAMGAA